jgi:hypothetical protein
MTNKEFGRRVGCDASMASYLRNGQRSPGTDTFVTIILEFELDPIEAMDAYRLGPEIFSRYLQMTVFEYRTSFTADERTELGIGTSVPNGTDRVG